MGINSQTKNDALAIIQAALLPDITFISGKSAERSSSNCQLNNFH
jgi:hypothetical protein